MVGNIKSIFNKVTKEVTDDDSLALTFLKNGYKVLDNLSKTISSLTSKIKLPKSIKDLKPTSIFNGIKDILTPNKEPKENIDDKTETSITSKLSNLFKASPEESNAPPTNKEELISLKIADKLATFKKNTTDSILKKVSSIIKELSDKEEKSFKISNVISPVEKFSFKQGVKRNPFQKLKERMDKRKEEIAKEKEANKAKSDKGKGLSISSILTSILSKLGGLVAGVAGLVKPLVTGITKGIFSAVGWLSKKLLTGLGPLLFKASKFLTKSLGSIFGKLVNFSSKNIAKGSASLIKGGLKLGGKLIGKTAGFIAKSMPSILATGGRILGRTALALATGPVGAIAAIGTAIYGGYKLYKYLTRNNIDDDIYGKLTLLRLYAYGFNEPKKEHYSKVFDLEMLQKDFIVIKKTGIVFKKLDQETLDKIYDIFDVDISNKDQVKVFNTWYLKRFLPAFKSFITPLYDINQNLYLDKLDALKKGDLENYTTNIRVSPVVFSVGLVPTFDDTEVYVNKEQYDALLTNIINQTKSVQTKKKDVSINKVIEENRAYKNKDKIDQNKINTIAESQREQLNKLTKKLDKKIDVSKMPLDPSSEGENELKKPDEEKVSSTKASKINIAGGDLYPGGTNLEGITTRLPKEKIYNLDPNIRELFTGMAKEFHTVTGKKIPVTQAYRSPADQRRLYRQNPRKAAPPGRSLHEFGLAIDIDSRTANELDKLGLMKKYGFTRPVSGEWWHVEPIGISLNPTYYRDNPNERLDAIQSSIGKGGGGYAIESRKGKMKRPARNIAYQKEIFNASPAKVIEESTKPLDKIAKSTATIPVTEDKKPTDILKPISSKVINKEPTKLTAKNTEDYESKPVSISKTTKTDSINKQTDLPKEQPVQKETKKAVSLYKATNLTPTREKVAKPKVQEQPVTNIQIDTSSMESMMSKQVDVLTQIAAILTGIDGKIDLEKISKLASNSSTLQSPYKDITPSKNSVDLRNTKII